MSKIYRAALCLAVTAALPAIPATAQVNTSTAGTRATDPGQFDILGIRLRMTPADVRTALRAAGFNNVRESTSEISSYRYSLEQALRERRSTHPVARTGASISMISAVGPANERVRISFVDMETGPIVSTVQLDFDHGASNLETLRAQVFARYGAPTRPERDGSPNIWCATTDNQCNQTFGRRMTLTFTASDYMRLLLDARHMLFDERAAAIAAEVDRRYPRQPSRF